MTSTLPPFSLEGEARQEAFQTAGAKRPPSEALPCQKGNNSILDDFPKGYLKGWQPKEKPLGKETAKGASATQGGDTWRLVTPYHAKAAFALSLEVKALCEKYGIEKIGFLTLTFKDNVLDLREAQRRYNSLATNVLRDRYSEFITVAERQSSGRVHYHLIVVLSQGIRNGFDFEGIARRDYRSANRFLRSEWAFWLKTAPAYRFGRTELLPIKTTVKAMANYVGKYIGKHIGMRQEKDKGCRLVRCSVEARKASVQFMWNSKKARLWRSQLASWSAFRGIDRYEQLSQRLGACWAWFFGDQIMAFENGPESRQDAPQTTGTPETTEYVMKRDSVFRAARPERYEQSVPQILRASPSPSPSVGAVNINQGSYELLL